MAPACFEYAGLERRSHSPGRLRSCGGSYSIARNPICKYADQGPARQWARTVTNGVSYLFCCCEKFFHVRPNGAIRSPTSRRTPPWEGPAPSAVTLAQLDIFAACEEVKAKVVPFHLWRSFFPCHAFGFAAC